MSEHYSGGSQRSNVSKSARNKQKKKAQKSYKKGDAIRKFLEELQKKEGSEAEEKLITDLSNLSY